MKKKEELICKEVEKKETKNDGEEEPNGGTVNGMKEIVKGLVDLSVNANNNEKNDKNDDKSDGDDDEEDDTVDIE